MLISEDRTGVRVISRPIMSEDWQPPYHHVRGRSLTRHNTASTTKVAYYVWLGRPRSKQGKVECPVAFDWHEAWDTCAPEDI